MSQAGRPEAAFVASMFAWMVLARTHEESHALMNDSILKAIVLYRSKEFFERLGFKHPLGDLAEGYHSYVPSELDAAQAGRALSQIPFEAVHDYFLHGTPDDVIDDLSAYERAGCNHVVLYEISLVADPMRASTRRQLLMGLLDGWNNSANSR